MSTRLKRGMAAVAATAAIATAAPIIAAAPASAATNNGSPVVSPTSGQRTTPFTMQIQNAGGGSGTCPGTGGDGWMWSTFLIPAAADVNGLSWGPTGAPTVVAGEFRSNLYRSAGANTPVRGEGVGSDTVITGIPQMNFNSTAFNSIPSGTYNMGIACHGGPDIVDIASYWAQTITVTNNAGTINWQLGAPAPKPVISSVTAGDGTLQVAFGAVTADPAVTGYTATAYLAGTSTVAGTATGGGTPLTITGLVNGTTYDVTVAADNGVGSPVESDPVAGTPVLVHTAPAVTATPTGVGTATVTWTPAGGSPTAYEVSVPGAATQTILATDTLQADFTGLAAGSNTFTVLPIGYPAGEVATPGQDTATVLGGDGTPATLIQTINVSRAQIAAIVFEQDCGSGWTTADCSLDLTDAVLDANAQYYVATGDIYPIRVEDARDADNGWVVTAKLDDFEDGVKTFSAEALGWDPVVTSQSGPLGDGYAMTVAKGATFAPWSSQALKDGTAVLMQSVADSGVERGLGYAVADAELTLHIPVSVASGDYSAKLTFTLNNK